VCLPTEFRSSSTSSATSTAEHKAHAGCIVICLVLHPLMKVMLWQQGLERAAPAGKDAGV